MTYTQHFTPILYLYGMFVIFCTFTVHGSIFVVIVSQLTTLLPDITTSSSNVHHLLRNPIILLCAPQLHEDYKASSCRIKDRNNNLQPSPLSKSIFLSKNFEVLCIDLTTQIYKTQDTHCKPSVYNQFLKNIY